MVLNVHRNHKAHYGRGEWGVGEEGEIIYLSLHCHHQNGFCIKMVSDASHFNASLTVRDKVTRQCPQTTTFEEKGEPKLIRTEVPLLSRPNALSLGQTGLLVFQFNFLVLEQKISNKAVSVLKQGKNTQRIEKVTLILIRQTQNMRKL